ncbi:MAG: MFS transporter [Litoreibacter sp.]|nr:MFS transporter [Litoreibacter sp.]
MKKDPQKKRILGWMMFDWASQPYNTLLLTFIFGPYFAEIVSNRGIANGVEESIAKAEAQSLWGLGLTLSGFAIAILAPILGAVADSSGRRMPYIYAFSILYVIGAGGLWYAAPGSIDTVLILSFFIIGLVGMEFATTFTNAMLPDLGPGHELGRISGSGWAVGYLGGLIALIFMLCFLAENEQGKTLIGISPILGLDSAEREGTRSVGPFAALWFIVFMIPFYAWVKEDAPKPQRQVSSTRSGLCDLIRTIKRLPRTPSLASFLGSSMLYRDGLNGMYTFGGIYAYGVLGWTVVDVGIFGILAVTAGAFFAYIGGFADRRFGPKPVIRTCIIVLILAAVGIVSIARDNVMGMPIPEGSSLPDTAFLLCGATIGAAGGVLQSASRTMLVRQGNPMRMTEAFGLYALAGKATSFLAPALIGLFTTIFQSQRIGVSPVLGLFVLALLLLIWVKPQGEDKSVWASAD